MAKKKATKKKAAKKLTKAKKRAKKATSGKKPTLVITVLDDCSVSNNQNLDPPHLSASEDGGFPHQVKFTAETEVWICIPDSGLADFQNPPTSPIHLQAGGKAGPYIVKTDTASTEIPFSTACDGPCTDPDPGGDGDSIIIDP